MKRLRPERFDNSLEGWCIEAGVTMTDDRAKDALDRLAVAEIGLVREDTFQPVKTSTKIMFRNDDRHLAAEPGAGPGRPPSRRRKEKATT